MPSARRSDPETSHEAAVTVWQPSEVQAVVLSIVRENGPICDDGIYREYARRAMKSGAPLPTPASVRTRRKELEKNHLVQFSGIYTLSPSLRRTQEWSAVE